MIRFSFNRFITLDSQSDTIIISKILKNLAHKVFFINLATYDLILQKVVGTFFSNFLFLNFFR